MAMVRLGVVVLLLHFDAISTSSEAASLVANDSEVRVFIPSDNSLGLSWTGGAAFDDSAWIHGIQGVGFDFAPDYLPMIQTNLRVPMYGNSSTAFIRLPFSVDLPHNFASLSLSVDYDDGFAAYLNGVEVARVNVPSGDLTLQSTSPIALGVGTEPGLFELDLTSYLPSLRTGENVLAFYGMNNGVAESSDFLIRARLTAGEAVPEPPSLSLTTLAVATAFAGARLVSRRTIFNRCSVR